MYMILFRSVSMSFLRKRENRGAPYHHYGNKAVDHDCGRLQGQNLPRGAYRCHAHTAVRPRPRATQQCFVIFVMFTGEKSRCLARKIV